MNMLKPKAPPALPEPEVMPDPDDKELKRAAARKTAKSSVSGRSSTLLSRGIMNNKQKLG